jgi:hypothetical protein
MKRGLESVLGRSGRIPCFLLDFFYVDSDLHLVVSFVFGSKSLAVP